MAERLAVCRGGGQKRKEGDLGKAGNQRKQASDCHWIAAFSCFSLWISKKPPVEVELEIEGAHRPAFSLRGWRICWDRFSQTDALEARTGPPPLEGKGTPGSHTPTPPLWDLLIL